jgi:hypothetical protein
MVAESESLDAGPPVSAQQLPFLEMFLGTSGYPTTLGTT